MATMGGMFLAHELGTNQAFPSFFEVFMQDRIHQSLKPAVRHVFLVLAERWPRAFLPLLDHFNEAFALLSLFLERHYLARNDALLAESLYGFKRSRYNASAAAASSSSSSSSSSSAMDGMTPLTQTDRRKALLLNVLAPYSKSKLDALYTEWSTSLPPPPSSSSSSSSPQQEDVKLRLRRAFVAMYPLLHASYEGSFFVYQWYVLYPPTHPPMTHLTQTPSSQ